MKIYQSVKRIARYRKEGFKHVTKELFFYSRKSELEQKHNNIVAWLIIEDSENYDIPIRAVLEISFYRARARSVSEWARMWTEKTSARSEKEREHLNRYGRKKHQTLLETLNNNILASLNARHNADWRVINLIGWAHGISRYRRSEISKRTKTAKTRDR